MEKTKIIVLTDRFDKDIQLIIEHKFVMMQLHQAPVKRKK